MKLRKEFDKIWGDDKLERVLGMQEKTCIYCLRIYLKQWKEASQDWIA
jgi:hypothetical protein